MSIIFKKTDKPVKGGALLKPLIDIRGHRCECCGLTEWLNQPITLEVHHIDGDKKNNKLNNLQSSYDKQKGEEIALEIQREKEKTEYFCIDCGKKISYKANRCQKCAELHNRIVKRPDRETFKKEIREQPFTVLSKKYGVSDNAIRKWCDNYNLPRTKREINSYKDLEWQSL